MELINNIVKGLAKVFQFFLQFLAGEEDTALHGAQREVQLFSDFAVLEAGNVHSERNSIFFRERVDYPMHFFQVVRSFRTFKAGVLRQVQMIKIIGLIDECLVANYFTVVVDKDIAHDGITSIL